MFNVLFAKSIYRCGDFLDFTIIVYFTNVIVVNNCCVVTFVKIICFTKIKFVYL